MLFIIFRYITVISAIFLLSGCLGGGIAQQIVSTIATRIADKAIAKALDVQDGPSNRKPSNAYSNNSYANNTVTHNNVVINKDLSKKTTLLDTPQDSYHQDPYQMAIMNMAFEPVKAIPEPISTQTEVTETRIAITEGNQLVRVELFNLLIGDEKNAVYEKARLLGATSLPQKREWQRWGVGTGAFTQDGQNDKKIITFLIPPEFGKLPSGSIAMVELASPGELNVARYKGN